MTSQQIQERISKQEQQAAHRHEQLAALEAERAAKRHALVRLLADAELTTTDNTATVTGDRKALAELDSRIEAKREQIDADELVARELAARLREAEAAEKRERVTQIQARYDENRRKLIDAINAMIEIGVSEWGILEAAQREGFILGTAILSGPEIRTFYARATGVSDPNLESWRTRLPMPEKVG